MGVRVMECIWKNLAHDYVNFWWTVTSVGFEIHSSLLLDIVALITYVVTLKTDCIVFTVMLTLLF